MDWSAADGCFRPLLCLFCPSAIRLLPALHAAWRWFATCRLSDRFPSVGGAATLQCYQVAFRPS